MSSPQPPALDALLANTAFVRRVARAVLGADDRVEDVVQETWVVALRTGPDHPGALRAWLGRVARNLALKVRRQDAARRAREHAAARPETPPPIDALVEQERMRRRLVDAVLALEEPYRTVLLLRYHQGLSARRVAALLQVPVETVRTRLKRGAVRVRILLEADHDGRGTLMRGALLTLTVPGSLGWACTVGLGVGALAMKKTTVVVLAVLLLGLGVWKVPGLLGSDPSDGRKAEQRSTGPEPKGSAATLAGRTPDSEETPEPAKTQPEDKTATGIHLSIRVVDEVTEQPVVGAVVTLCHEFSRMDTEPSGTTNDEGRVALRLPRRRDANSCIVQHPEYAPYVKHLHEALRDRVEGDQIDFGPVRMIRGSSVRGRVLSQDGRHAIANAELVLSSHRSPGSFGFAHWEMQRLSNETGRFHLERVRPSPFQNWFLYAVSEDSIGWVELPGSVGRDDLDGIEVRLQPTASVRVRVQDEAGQPVAGAMVQAQPHFEPMRTASMGRGAPRWFMSFRTSDRVQGMFEGKSDAEGIAHFDSVPVTAKEPARYRASATAEGLLPTLTEPFDLAEGATHEVTITLSHATTITLAGVVVNRTGTPIEEARILLNGKERAKTDAEGRFAVPQVNRSHGWTQLRVLARGFAEIARHQVLPKTGDLEGLRVELWAVKPLAGRVVDQDGVPVQGAYADLLRLGRDVPVQSPVRTDGEGRFLMANATTQEFNLRVIPPRPYWHWRRMVGGYPVVRGGQKDVVVVLERLGAGKARIAVAVRDEVTGDPLDPTDAMLIRKDYESGIQSPRRTIEAGRVVVEGVHPGTYVLWVRVAGRPAAWTLVTVGETDRDVQADVEIITSADLGSIRGRIDFGALEKPKSIYVQSSLADTGSQPQWAGDAGGHASHFTRVAADGTFVLPGLIPGRHRVYLAILRGWLGEAEVEVARGQTHDVVLAVRPAAVIRMNPVGEIPADTATLRFYTSKDGTNWTIQMNLGYRPGDRMEHAATVEPGRWHWKVVFDADNIHGGNRISATTQTGVVEVAVGETAKVDVPVKPRDK